MSRAKIISEEAYVEIEEGHSSSETIPLRIFDDDRKKVVEKLFDSLMPCWMDPGIQSSTIQSPKFLYEKGEEILTKLYDVMEDKTLYVYHYVGFTIICQYLCDVHREQTSSPLQPVLSVSAVVERNFERVFQLKNDEYRVKILQIFIVYWEAKKGLRETFNQKVQLLRMSDENSGFFELAILLKERKVVEFQSEFELYLLKARKAYGDYYNVVLKPLVRLLSKIAGEMFKTETFIFQNFPSIEINSSIMKNFNDVQDFNIFTKNSLSTGLEQRLNPLIPDLKVFENQLKGFDTENSKLTKQIKRFLFSRNINEDEDCKTVFERILSKPGAAAVIQLIWEKFNLDKHSEILNLRNPQGKLLMNYVIESGDDENLVALLMPQIAESKDAKFSRKPCYLKMLNNQFMSLTEKTLFEHYVYICANDVERNSADLQPLSHQFFRILFTFLEDFGEIEDINRDFPIEKLLKLANDEEYYMEFVDGVNSLKQDELKQARYYVDDLLGVIIAYWKPSDPNFEDYKKKLTTLSPFFKMAINIIEHKDEEFILSFWNDLKSLEESYSERYGENTYDENTYDEPLKNTYGEPLTTNFLFILLLTAMLNNREAIIDRILKYESFVGIDIYFPSNIRNNRTSQHVAKRMLDYGYEIGRKEIPAKWITSKVFNEFLDSRIKFESEDLVELDCSFLLHNHTKQYQVNDVQDVDNKLIFWEDTESLEFISNSETLKHLLSHPVISTYVNLKVLKIQSIYTWNFLIYILFFVLPFGSLIVLHFLTDRENDFIEFLYIAAKFICPLSVIYLVAHEGVQYYFVDKTFKVYFSKKANWLETSLIVTSSLMVVVYVFESIDFFEKYLLTAFSVLTILLSTMVILAMLPHASMLIHMIMLKKVGKTFIKFFATFICILFAFTLSFCVIFGIKSDRYDYGSIAKHEGNGSAAEETFKNFETFPTSFMKVILMLSGEYQLEPHALTHVNILIMLYQMTFFLFFVLSTFILFNLILGLTIDDVKLLRENALRLTLKNNVERIIATKKISYSIYEKYKLDRNKTFDHLSFLEKTSLALFKKCITKYPYLHKIDRMYVNVRTKEVTLNVKGKQEKVLTKLIGSRCNSYFIDQEAFDYITNIIKQ